MRTLLTATGMIFLLVACLGVTARSGPIKPELVITSDPLTKCCDEICSVAFSPDGSTIAAKLYHSDFLGGDGIILWDATRGSLIKGVEFAPSGVFAIEFGPAGRTVGLPLGQIYDIQNKTILRLGTPEDRIYCIAFSPHGELIATSHLKAAYKITLWEATTGKRLRMLTSEVKTGGQLQFSRDGKTLVAAGVDLVQFWSLESGQVLRTMKPECGQYDLFAYNGEASIIAVTQCGDRDSNVIELVDAETGRRINQLDGHTSVIWSLNMSPDGRFLVSSSGDLTIKLWDIASGSLLRTFNGHSKIVRTVVFSPDGQTIASGGGDNETKLWSTASGGLIATFRPFKDGNWIVYTPDGYYACSERAAKYISWRVGEELFDESAYRRQFLQPGIIAQRLQHKR